jgi:mannose-1-phosphate guanylyltransferase
MQEKFIVIMAGGRGERFWPESRLKRPKHLLPIVGDKPMLNQAIDRLGDSVPKENIYIITNVLQAPAIKELCPELPEENIVSEPVGRDTAPAVALATALVKMRNPDGIFAMLPADHVIGNDEGFQKCLDDGFKLAESKDCLVTIGIAPTHPATGYGYIHRGAGIELEGVPNAYDVQRFVEKPDLQTATDYLNSGEYYWNAGMFVWKVSAIEQAFSKYSPGLYADMNQMVDKIQSGEPFAEVLESVYPTLEKISIDFSIMEKADNVVTVESTFVWDDVGEWLAIERHGEKDGDGNLISGLGVAEDSKNNLIYNDGSRVTTVLGVEDLIVVHTADATLVCHKSKAQQIKKIVKQLGESEDTKGFI